MCLVPARFLAEAQDNKAREWWSEPEPQHGRGSASECPRVAVAEVEVADCLLEQGSSTLTPSVRTLHVIDVMPCATSLTSKVLLESVSKVSKLDTSFERKSRPGCVTSAAASNLLTSPSSLGNL